MFERTGQQSNGGAGTAALSREVADGSFVLLIIEARSATEGGTRPVLNPPSGVAYTQIGTTQNGTDSQLAVYWFEGTGEVVEIEASTSVGTDRIRIAVLEYEYLGLPVIHGLASYSGASASGDMGNLTPGANELCVMILLDSGSSNDADAVETTSGAWSLAVNTMIDYLCSVADIDSRSTPVDSAFGTQGLGGAWIGVKFSVSDGIVPQPAGSALRGRSYPGSLRRRRPLNRLGA